MSVDNSGSFIRRHGLNEKTYPLSGSEILRFVRPAKSYPGNPDSHYRLGSYYQMKGRDDKALKEFEKVILIDPNCAMAYNRIGISYDRLGDFPNAVMFYRAALELNPSLYYVYNNLGYSYKLQGHYEKAIEMFKKAIALDQDNTRILNNLARVYAMIDRYDLAMEEFKKAAGEAWAYYSIARIYYERGMFNKAEDSYKKALELNPSFADSPAGVEMLDILTDDSEDISRKKEKEGFAAPFDSTQGYLKETGMEPDFGKFGCIAPLTGPLSKYGEKLIRGATIAVSDYNTTYSASVDIVIVDSMAMPEIAQECVKTLAYQEKVAAIIGPLLTSTAMSAASTAQQIGIPLFVPTSPGEGLPETGDFIFRNCLSSLDQTEALADYAVNEMGLESFAIFSPSNIYGREMTDLFTDQINRLGGDIDIIEFYDQRDTDFKEQLIRINQVKPDALFIPDSYKKIALIAPQVSFYTMDEEDEETQVETEMEPIQLLGSNGWYNEKLIEEAEPYVEGAIVSIGFYTESTDSRIRSFIQNFEERYGESPDLISAQAYDATNMLLKASDGATASWDMIRERLHKLRNFPCVTGMTDILPSGDSKKEVTLLRIEGDRFVPIKK